MPRTRDQSPSPDGLGSVLLVTPVAEAGGSDHALLRIARSLRAAGVRVRVVVPGPSPLAARFASAGVELHHLPMRRLTGSGGWVWWLRYLLEWPVAVLRLARATRACGADVVVTNSSHSWYGWAAAALARRPHVWHAREIVVQSRLALAVEQQLLRRADLVVACSRAVADQFSAAVPDGRLVVVHEDVDRDEFAPARAGRFRSRLGLPETAPLVAFVGRVDTWKGVDVLLRAWPDVRSASPAARLVVVGGPVRGKEAYYRQQERRAGVLEGVTWVGPVGDSAEVMADVDVLAAPSTSPEPYGLVLVEALASGARVVTTDAGGPPEILARAAAGAGALIPAGDATALAAGLVQCLEAAAQVAEGQRERTPLLDPFPVDWARLYASVLARRGPSGPAADARERSNGPLQ